MPSPKSTDRRPRGSGSVFRPRYKGPDGAMRTADTWAITYYNRRTRKHPKEYGFPTEAKAEAALRTCLVDLSRGRRVGPEIDRLTFDQLAELIENDYKANKRRTEKRLEQTTKHLKKAFGGDRAIDITGDRVTAYARARLEEGPRRAR